MATLKSTDFPLDEDIEEVADGVVAPAGSEKFNLENARKNTKVLHNITLSPESQDIILRDMNRLIGTDRFNPSDYPIDIEFLRFPQTSHFTQTMKMFNVRIQVDPDCSVVISNLGYRQWHDSDSPDITPAGFEVTSLRAIGSIENEKGEISNVVRRLGLRLTKSNSSRLLLNNEMEVERELPKNDTESLEETMRTNILSTVEGGGTKQEQ